MDEPFQPRKELLPVVGLGGSSGSVEALKAFFSSIKGPTGCAYVVVVHLSSDHESGLPAVLRGHTSMPVLQVEDASRIQADHIYVISPGKHLSLTDGTIQATEMVRQKGKLVTVDLFFRTLADNHGVKAAAIVLSGSDGDGAIGLKRIKERGGLTIVQDPTEAEYDAMPRAAIGTGMVDWVLPIAAIPSRLLEYRENGRKIHLPADFAPKPPLQGDENDEAFLREVLAFLKARTGHDFGYYKRATILRRVGRRMQVNGSGDLEGYLAFLRTHPGETGALLQDLLISVTNFFRDKDAFASLEKIIPELFKNKGPHDQIRVWVPACATGEEAYSIAILLCEHASKIAHPPQIQVFATDLDQIAIDTAREGRYPETILADMSEDRLRLYFSKDSGSYRVRRSVREVVLFALHDLLKDSPFSRLDLVSCRNLLIYLNREAQGKAFDIFHFALRPNGYLFLGSSESAEGASDLFIAADKKQRLYVRRPIHRVGAAVPPGAPPLSFPVRVGQHPSPPPSLQAQEGDINTRHGWSDLHLRLIETIAPPSLVVTRNHDIVHLSKSAGKFLQFFGGEPTTNLLGLAHPQLRSELRAALFRAPKSGQPVLISGVPVELDGEPRWVDISVRSIADVSPDFLLVTFNQHGTPPAPAAAIVPHVTRSADAELVAHLEQELDQMRADWKDTAEQYEASTEELKASNEELQAMNEELRSATEELETGREELQSINEEIITINQELKSKVDELSRTNSDLQNLMASTKIATIFLDRKLQISRFTPSTTGLFNFIPSDIGRPLTDLTHRLDYPQITADAEQVLDDLSLVEREVRDLDGRWFLARMFPYRTTEDQIAGVVITCVDITQRKQTEEDLRRTRDELEARVEQRTSELRKRAKQLALMASELTLTEQRERKRMARVLHDQLQQTLVAAKMRVQSLDTLEPGQKEAEVGPVVKLLDEALDNSRSLAIELSPPILAEGLGRALEWLCGTWMNDQYQLKVKYHIDTTLDARQDDIRNLVFLAVRELLFNVVKHSGILEANVELCESGDDELKITVRDHGLGFDMAEDGNTPAGGSGFGLFGLRERLEMLGGSLRIHSRKTKGVEATILAPRAKTN